MTDCSGKIGQRFGNGEMKELKTSISLFFSLVSHFEFASDNHIFSSQLFFLFNTFAKLKSQIDLNHESEN